MFVVIGLNLFDFGNVKCPSPLLLRGEWDVEMRNDSFWPHGRGWKGCKGREALPLLPLCPAARRTGIRHNMTPCCVNFFTITILQNFALQKYTFF